MKEGVEGRKEGRKEGDLCQFAFLYKIPFLLFFKDLASFSSLKDL